MISNSWRSNLKAKMLSEGVEPTGHQSKCLPWGVSGDHDFFRLACFELVEKRVSSTVVRRLFRTPGLAPVEVLERRSPRIVDGVEGC